MNIVIVSGIITQTPKTVSTQTGKVFTAFTIESMKVHNGKTYKTFVDVTAFGGLGTQLLSLGMGANVLVHGSLSARKRTEEIWTLGVIAFAVEKMSSSEPPAPSFEEDIPM